MDKVKFQTTPNMRTDIIHLYLAQGMLKETNKVEGRQREGALQSAHNPFLSNSHLVGILSSHLSGFSYQNTHRETTT